MSIKINNRAGRILPLLGVLCLGIALVGCQNKVFEPSFESESIILAQEFKSCGVRNIPSGAVACTAEYYPVCGQVNVGAKVEFKTYANACNACGVPEVVGYAVGACNEVSTR